ncbi:MAG: hypothetical protein CM15mP74_29640 [Halieaceae bacterium]|nr:MAG: hypothetical protein CM15mP74_29640 [Halieaceae bacterium]
MQSFKHGTQSAGGGCGLSGLNAALILERWGYEVEVVEARDRVGGRLWTLDHVPGSPEGGGNVIGANYGRSSIQHNPNVPLRTPRGRYPATMRSVASASIARTGRPLLTTPADGWRATPPGRLVAN